jgi:hypothetical protein
MNLNGRVTHADVADALREHRMRIRNLEANPAGAGRDTRWFAPPLLNGWKDASTGADGDLDPPVGYMRTFDGHVRLRGRLVGGTPDQGGNWQNMLPAFFLPAGFDVDPNLGAVYFLCEGGDPWNGGAGTGGSHQAFIRIDRSDGAVRPFIHQSGFMSANPVTGMAIFAPQGPVVGGNPLDPYAWLNTTNNDYGYDASANLIILPGKSLSPPGVMYLPTGPGCDTEVSVTVQSGCDTIWLGLRLQPLQGGNSFFPTGVTWPPGLWQEFSRTAGGPIRWYDTANGGSPNLIGTSAITSPGISNGDLVGFRVSRQGSFESLVNGTRRGSLTGTLNSTFQNRMGSGLVGVGAVANARSVPIFSDMHYGLGGLAGFSLSDITFKAA